MPQRLLHFRVLTQQLLDAQPSTRGLCVPVAPEGLAAIAPGARSLGVRPSLYIAPFSPPGRFCPLATTLEAKVALASPWVQ
jgi:hypothetical protein